MTSTEFTKNEAFIAALGLVELLASQMKRTPQHFDVSDITALINVTDVLISDDRPIGQEKNATAAAMSALHKLMEIYTNAN